MAAAFDELSLWCSGRFGAGQPLGRLAEAGEWGTARWASPLAEVEMHGRTNSLGDTRIWSVDLRGGVIKAVEDAEVELTYLRGNPP
jgi:hypothetical protein